MGSIFIYEGMPPLTEEQEKRLSELEDMKDEEIDFSDIPELTEEDWKKMRRVNPLPEVERIAI